MFEKATQKSTKGSGVKMTGPILETGGYPAILTQIIDLGKQPGSKMYPEPAYKMVMKFEFTDEFMLDDKGEELLNEPRYMNYEVSYQPDGFIGPKSNLHKILTAISGFEKGPSDWLGTKVQLGVEKKPKDKLEDQENPAADVNFKNRIVSVGVPRPKDAAKMPDETIAEQFVFSLSQPVDMLKKHWDKLSKGSKWSHQDRIKASLEVHESALVEFVDCGARPETPVQEPAQDPSLDEDVPEFEPDGAGGVPASEESTADDPFA